MNRHLVSCLMLILLVLQGVAASASALSFGDMPARQDTHVMAHGDVSDGASSGSCDCCDDDCMPDSVCAAYCSVCFPAISLIVFFDVPATNESIAFVSKTLLDPEYVPLNPPPIA